MRLLTLFAAFALALLIALVPTLAGPPGLPLDPPEEVRLREDLVRLEPLVWTDAEAKRRNSEILRQLLDMARDRNAGR
jgi:hypothetical protein